MISCNLQFEVEFRVCEEAAGIHRSLVLVSVRNFSFLLELRIFFDRLGFSKKKFIGKVVPGSNHPFSHQQLTAPNFYLEPG